MRNIYEQIHELEGIPGLSKHEQFVQGIINSINAKTICQGDLLPSVNQLISELGKYIIPSIIQSCGPS